MARIEYDASDVTDLIAELEEAGAKVDVIDLVGIAERMIAEPMRARTPRRGGTLASSIRVEPAVKPTTGLSSVRIVQDVSIAVYGPIIHFGWSTRGIGKRAEDRGSVKESRKAFRERLSGTFSEGGSFTERAANKAFRQARGSKNRRPTRGGPIKPQPWMYRTADARINEVHARYEREVEAIAKAFG